ncbi:YqaA family protein [Azotosporobacter soli]|uniref:YqaA family protein n=1 Tax=Azotosporobacter soli TaxID=3055040 RepID=UPI0031FE9148
MEAWIPIFQNYGVSGLFVLSFIESFISPILPDLLLIPMALAMPQEAIYYSAVATTGSVLGGFVGYGAGGRFGIPLVQRFIPAEQAEKIREWIEKYGGWAIFFAAMAPIPYKFVSISAGVFRVNLLVFFIASVLGRGKRFLLEGVLIYYYGPKALELITNASDHFLILFLMLVVGGIIAFYWYRREPSRENE